MREQFSDVLVSGHESPVVTLDLPHPPDLHGLAAAIQCDAQRIMTDNINDFPEYRLKPHGITVIDVVRIHSEALVVLRLMCAHYGKPPCSPPAFIPDLTANGLTKLAGFSRRHRDFL